MSIRPSLTGSLILYLVFALLVLSCARTVPQPGERFDSMTLHLYFDEKNASIQERDFERLDRAVALVKSYPYSKIVIEGHTDNMGSKEGNHALSHERAENVKRYFVQHGGLDPLKIKTIGYGETRPIASNSTRDGRDMNRRVVVLIYPK